MTHREKYRERESGGQGEDREERALRKHEGAAGGKDAEK